MLDSITLHYMLAFSPRTDSDEGGLKKLKGPKAEREEEG